MSKKRNGPGGRPIRVTKLAAKAAPVFPPVGPNGGQSGPPTQRKDWLGPRFEPINISATATISAIQTAIRQAENGETRELFRFYRDSLLGDDHIQGELNKRKLAVTGQPLAVLPADKTSEDDIMAAAACLRAIEDCENWLPGLNALLSSSQWPVSMAENIFQAAKKPVRYQMPNQGGDIRVLNAERPKPTMREFKLQYTFKRIEPVNPMLFCFRHAYMVGGVGIGTSTPVQQAGLGKVNAGAPLPARPGDPQWWAIDLNDWEPFLRIWPIDSEGRIIYDASQASKLDPDRHIVHRGHLLTDQKDNWGGPMRAVMALWLMRRLGLDYFGQFMERFGMPFPVGKTNVNDPESVNYLTTAFSMATKVGGLVIGQDDEVDLLSAIVQGGAEGHEKWHTVLNNAISRHITGVAPGDRPGGLNAGQSNTDENVRSDVRIFDQKMLAETLLRQPFERLLRFNGLQGQVRIAWGGLSDEDAKTFADLLKTLSEAGFEPTDQAIPAMQEKLGIEIRRKAAVAPVVPPGGPEMPGARVQAPRSNIQDPNGKDGNEDEDTDIELMAARIGGRLVCFSAGSEKAHPLDSIVARRVAALSAAYRGAMAPFREIILNSNSKEEAMRKLTAAYSDWKPGRLERELEEALQLCAAAGAVAGKVPTNSTN